VATNNLFQSPPAPPPVRGNVPVVPLKPVPIPGGGGGPPKFANVLVRSIVLIAALHAINFSDRASLCAPPRNQVLADDGILLRRSFSDNVAQLRIALTI